MLKSLINVSLNNRGIVMAAAVVLCGYGFYEMYQRPVDIFPELNQPVVTVLTQATGYSPEEVETLVTIPIESSLAGATGVERIRSFSGDGLSIVRADFGWGTDIYRDRQLVQERLQLAEAELPKGIEPEMTPISSLTGEVMDIGLLSTNQDVDPLEVHTLAEWVIRRRLLSVPGVSQIVVIGGNKKQYQVMVDPEKLVSYGLSLTDVRKALARAGANTSGSYITRGNQELIVRNMGRVETKEQLGMVVVDPRRKRPVLVRDVARVSIGPAVSRGVASVDGNPAVLLMIFKQPDANTISLTQSLDMEIDNLRKVLPAGVELRTGLFRQATFLERGVDNVVEALRDGALLVILVIMLFVFDVKAAGITLLAIPLSFAAAGVLFKLMGLTLNTMTLGGLAIAVGELVDDAIVGVENVIRKLRGSKGRPLDVEKIVATASAEVRGPIFSGTIIVVLVFVPLFALSGLEGRLFSPLAVSYITALLASMLVSLTITPVLSYLLFRGRGRFSRLPADRPPLVLRLLRRTASVTVTFSVKRRKAVLSAAFLIAACGGILAANLGTDFLPEFDEGTVLVILFLPPGTSLEESNQVAMKAESLLKGMPGVKSFARYTGRGEHDEHAPPVTISHILLALDEGAQMSRAEVLDEVRKRLRGLGGVEFAVGQPLAHRIDHLMSGVRAQIAIKVFGDDLQEIHGLALEVARIAQNVPGVTDLYVEPLESIPQVHIRLPGYKLAESGLSPGELAADLETAIGGTVVSEVLEGERRFDVFLRLNKDYRDSIEALRNLPVALPKGGWARLGALASVDMGAGPTSISRDNLIRRVAVSCNASGPSVGDVVSRLKSALKPLEEKLPRGTFIRFEGQFESKERAGKLIGVLSLVSLAVVMLILYGQFKSLNLTIQVLMCIPAAFAGGVLFLFVAGETFNVPALVGLVSLAGIATRNGILLMEHYLTLTRDAGGRPTIDILEKAGRERAAPVVMTALTTGMGLLPILIHGGDTGREILFPVALVVTGGLITSTVFEFTLRPALFWSMGRKAAARVTEVKASY